MAKSRLFAFDGGKGEDGIQPDTARMANFMAGAHLAAGICDELRVPASDVISRTAIMTTLVAAITSGRSDREELLELARLSWMNATTPLSQGATAASCEPPPPQGLPPA